MDQVKDAFQKVKQDISSIQNEFSSLKSNLSEIQIQLVKLCDIVTFLYNENKTNKEKQEIKKKPELNKDLNKQERLNSDIFYIPKDVFSKINDLDTSTQNLENTTFRHETSTNNSNFKPLKHQNLPISTGNEGVSTDRQTDRQTNRHIQKSVENPINHASELLDSLDNIKKELRLKFKKLTKQEILVFSTIYQLEEEQGFANYKSLSEKLGLTESSIRDYVGRMIKKHIPVDKKKINNKNITLHISPNLKKMVSLSTILKLREL